MLIDTESSACGDRDDVLPSTGIALAEEVRACGNDVAIGQDTHRVAGTRRYEITVQGGYARRAMSG
ncbi:hypothetical protein CGLAUT_04545 [Corynebacterium glaucum]|nr:hypothetical protein CGLAUT_04545 [Corynebacterium glaucum]